MNDFKALQQILLKSLTSAGGLIGTAAPATAFFSRYCPPFLPEIGLVTSAFCAILYLTLSSVYDKNNVGDTEKNQRSWKGLRYLVFALCLFVVYVLLFSLCTVTNPQNDVRFQVGFGRADWSLTELGIKQKSDYPSQTQQQWMMTFGAFRDNGAQLIWSWWSIHLAAFLLMVLFLISFSFWTIGSALLNTVASANKR